MNNDELVMNLAMDDEFDSMEHGDDITTQSESASSFYISNDGETVGNGAIAI